MRVLDVAILIFRFGESFDAYIALRYISRPCCRRPARRMKTTSRLPHLELADFRVSPRLLYLVAMAAVVGGCGLLAAWALVKLIALATNLAYFADWSTRMRAIQDTPWGPVRILIPACGGIIIGLMARFGSE